MKRISLLALSATAAMAQAPKATAPVAAATAPAPVAAPVSYAAAPVSYAPAAATTEAASAPLAPISGRLLQLHPGAPVGVEDVLLVPSSSAGQKAVAFEWADSSQTQAYVLWNNIFAAAQITGGAAADAQTIASFGYMTPAFGAGLSIATRDTSWETVQSVKTTETRALTQLKLFGSATLPSMDVYGSIQRVLKAAYTVADNGDVTVHPAPRHEQFLAQVGARQYPAANAEGLAWNATVTGGLDYNRTAVGQKNLSTLIAYLDGQVGYVFISEGITFLPGLDAYLHYSNGPRSPDYSLVGNVSPYAAVLLPLFDHWVLKGGARYAFEQTLIDNQQGDPSVFNDHQLITGTSGNFGVRYERKRWAVEAQLGNKLLTKGPAIISGNDGTDAYNLFASLGLTVNLK
ncbi:MAG: hypothetical protein AAB214_01965 [Fibrobacterota bacterium]